MQQRERKTVEKEGEEGEEEEEEEGDGPYLYLPIYLIITRTPSSQVTPQLKRPPDSSSSSSSSILPSEKKGRITDDAKKFIERNISFIFLFLARPLGTCGFVTSSLLIFAVGGFE